MYKILSLILCVFMLTFTLSACSRVKNVSSKSTSMIKSERRFEKYLMPQKLPDGTVVDLSEGPRLRYNANFGPKNPEFDFKIQNPY